VPQPEDDVPAVAADTPATTKPGDLWQLGEHKLFAGDARNAESYDALLGDEQADMILTDPPYNVRIATVVGRGRTTHREFVMGSGELTSPQFTRFLGTAFQQMAGHSKDGTLAFVFSDAKHLLEMLTAGETAFDGLLNALVWDKGSGGQGGIYRTQHEHVLLFKIGKAPYLNNVQLGRHGRNRTTVWKYRGLASFGKDRLSDLQSHPTVKPCQMLADAMLDVTRRNAIILDPFAGSGSTLIAAEKTGRRARVCELDVLYCVYCDLIIRRWEAHSGRAATHDVTRLTFEEMADQRRQGST
jgi:DNA modification methylase